MIVAVGSSNPVKVKAVENVLSKFFSASVVAKAVETGVPPQPIGVEVTIRGAICRAKAAIRSEPSADLGVGIESGLLEFPSTISGYMDQQFAAIVDRDGAITLGGGPAFEYPSAIINKVIGERIEINDAMAALTGIKELGRKEGAIGYFSRGRLDRTRLTEQAVLMALIPRLNKDLYFPGQPQ